MSDLRIGVVALLVVVVVPGALRAQFDSGPKPGSDVPPLKAVAVTGESASKEVDFAALGKKQTTIFIFVKARTAARPGFPFLKAIDDSLAKDFKDVRSVVVCLTDDTAGDGDLLRRLKTSWKPSNTTVAAFASKGGPAAWKIHADAGFTAVVIQDGKVKASLPFQTGDKQDVRLVLQELKPKP